MRLFLFLLIAVFGLLLNGYRSPVALSTSAYTACPDPSSPSISQAFQSAGNMRKLEDIQDFRVGTYNVLNFLAKNANARTMTPDSRFQQIADIISRNNLDVVVLQEIESLEVAEAFASGPLNGAYKPFLIKGNDSRGITLAMLIRSDLPVKVTYVSNGHETFVDPASNSTASIPIFSRDLPVMEIRSLSQAEDAPPLLSVLGTHFKSKIDRHNDPESFLLRKAQADRAAEIIQRLQRKYGHDAPIILAGDFNSSPAFGPEFVSLWRSAHLEDAFNVLKNIPAFKDRVSHSFHGETPGDPVRYSQLDAVLVSPGLKNLVRSVKTQPYRDTNGADRPLPRTYQDRETQPSDHRMVFATFDFQGILKKSADPAPPSSSR